MMNEFFKKIDFKEENRASAIELMQAGSNLLPAFSYAIIRCNDAVLRKLRSNEAIRGINWGQNTF
jgi:hypothetical protein